MSFNFADAHCDVNIHNCLDSGSFGDTLKATQSLGLRFTTHSQQKTRRYGPQKQFRGCKIMDPCLGLYALMKINVFARKGCKS